MSEELLKLKDYLKYWNKNKMCTVFAFSNRKGGTGKTMTTSSVAYTLSQCGFRTLLIDNDPQQSLTNILGINNSFKNDPELDMKNLGELSRQYRAEEYKKYVIDDLFGYAKNIELNKSEFTGYHDLIMSVIENYPITKNDIEKAIVRPCFKRRKKLINVKKDTTSLKEINNMIEYEDVEFGFDLLPASEELTDDELLLSGDINMMTPKSHILSTIIKVMKEENMYDVILIDCPPSLGLFTINGIVASDGVVIVGMPEAQSMYSLAKLKKNLRDIKKLDSKQKGILGFVLNAVSNHNTMESIMRKKVISELQIKVFKETIPQSVKAQQATSTNMIFPQIDKRAQEAFKNLSREILQSYLDNEAWEEHRNVLYNEAIERLRNDPVIMEDISKQAISKLQEELLSRNTSIENIPANKRQELMNIFENMYLKDKIIEMFEAKQLWKQRDSTFGFKLRKEDL